MVWVGLAQSVEGLKRKKTDLPLKAEKLLPVGLCLNLSGKISSSPGLQSASLPCRFWIWLSSQSL